MTGFGQDFPSTRWSRLDQAGRLSTPEGRAATEELLRVYYPVLVTHLRVRFRIAVGDAEDLVQSFIAKKILEQHLLARADREKGRFRNLLRVALDNFALSELRRRKPVLELDALAAEDTGPSDIAYHEPDAFNSEWAVGVVRRAVEVFRSECANSGRQDLWRVFEARVLEPSMADKNAVDQKSLATELELGNATKVSNLLVTVKRQFSRILREIVAEYAGTEAEVEEEVIELRKTLAQRAENPRLRA